MRSSVLKKVEQSKKSGAGGSNLSELDNIILDVIGRESSYLNGLDQDDEAPTFRTHQPRGEPSQGFQLFYSLLYLQ